MNTLLQDVRYALRGLRKSPGFTSVAVLMLALGIGSTTTVFSVIYSVLWKPLPFPGPGRLVRLFETRPAKGIDKTVVADGEFVAWQARARSFDGLAAVLYPGFTLTSGGESHQIEGIRTSANFLELLGVRPLAGRFFTPAEGRPGAPATAVISSALWKTRLQGDPRIVGGSILLDGRPTTVVGVLPEGFNWYGKVDAIAPLVFDAVASANFHSHHLDVFGRLKAGVPLSRARAEMSAIAEAVARDHPVSRGDGIGIAPLREDMAGPAAGSLRVALGAILFVLLVACANLANLLLARASRRRREIAIRLAVGASRLRLVRQLLTESVVLAAAGAAAGIGLAAIGVASAAAFLFGMPRGPEIGLHPASLLFAAGLAAATGVAFGLAPALQAVGENARTRAGLAGSLPSAPRSGTRLRQALVAGEVALSLVLLLSGGLLLRTFWNLERVNPGFEPAKVAAVSVDPPEARYPSLPAAADFLERTAVDLASIPGADSAGVVNIIPLSGNDSGSGLLLDGDDDPAIDPPHVQYRVAGGSAFRALGIAIERGRSFDVRDRAGSEPVAIVNGAFARRFWSGKDPIGRRLKIGRRDPANPWRTVVGVSDDVRQESLDLPAVPEVDVPLGQWPVRRAVFVVRARRSPAALLAAIRGRLRAADPELPTDDLDVYPHLVSQSLASRRHLAQAVAGFAGAAFLLAAIGIYGVISYRVTERTREIGIRIALGARSGRVVSLIVGEGARVVAAGLLAGIAAAAVASRLLTSLLFGVRPADLATFAAVSALLFTTGIAAAWFPARRAARIDPMKALREE
ncbi:MAG TPA: ABC transporter permease [Thermoanaerobaculia bacterium]|nr:ABC transporter permease [Thermoanaerobaculia bacterium]